MEPLWLFVAGLAWGSLAMTLLGLLTRLRTRRVTDVVPQHVRTAFFHSSGSANELVFIPPYPTTPQRLSLRAHANKMTRSTRQVAMHP